MNPISRLWTWSGIIFIPAALGLIFFVTNALPGEPPAEGILISRAYFGLIVSLIVACVQSWCIALYLRMAKLKGNTNIIPMNTSFEEEKDRNLVISYSTCAIYLISAIIAVTIFYSRYLDSRIFGWNDTHPLVNKFIESRVAAHKIGCSHGPCYAISAHKVGNATIHGTIEYILYLSDGIILVLLLIAASGFIAIIVNYLRKGRFQKLK